MNLLLFFQSIRNPVFDVFAKTFTMLGEEYFVMMVFCVLMWCIDKKYSMKLALAFCFGMGINQILKISFCIQRPWVSDNRIVPSEYALDKATGYSFPSGHTQSGATLFGSLSYRFREKNVFLGICIVTALLIGTSRMYFGVHTPADVLTSFFIGIFVVLIVEKVYPSMEKNDIFSSAALVVFSVCIVIFATLKKYPSYHTANDMYDCIKIAGAISGYAIGWILERRTVKYVPFGNTLNLFIKTVAGLTVLVLLKFFFEKFFVQTMFFMYVQNFFLILWAVYMYPFILKQIDKKR